MSTLAGKSGSKTVADWLAPTDLVALRSEAGERVRAEPFSELELEVAVLLGDDEEEPAQG